MQSWMERPKANRGQQIPNIRVAVRDRGGLEGVVVLGVPAAALGHPNEGCFFPKCILILFYLSVCLLGVLKL